MLRLSKSSWLALLTIGAACSNQVSTSSSHGTSSSGSSTTSGSGGHGGGSFGPSGGTLDTLSFAVVGDTRPANSNDTANYPTSVITKIWQDVEAASPHVPFALATGDYQFSSTTGNTAGAQIDLYMGARANYSGFLFPVMGNHECTGGTTSNCGPGSVDGMTANYTAFLGKMLAPIQQTSPYYEVNVASSTPGAWTAKFVFIAANAWSSAQASWLDGALQKPTTYTFVVRHESSQVTTVTGVSASSAIIAKYPLTLLIVGHSHTYAHYANTKEVVVGNGGAPLTGGAQYGYVIARQRPSDGAITFQSLNYMTNMPVDTFSLKPDGSATM